MTEGARVEPTPEYLTFTELPQERHRTRRWRVTSAQKGDVLGLITWEAHWRQYALFPSFGTTWSAGCMAVVEQFLAEQNASHKQAAAFRRTVAKR